MVVDRLKRLGIQIGATPAAPPPRPGWSAFLVAQRPPTEDSWPAKDRPRVAQARANYDAGTHEMFTVVTQPDRWVQLYCRPRQSPAAKRHYFTRTGEHG